MSPIILSNISGPEGGYSEESCRDVAGQLNYPALDVGKEDELEQLIPLLATRVATVILATHGGLCENGTLQGLLISNGISFTHSSARACSIMSDKHAMKRMYVRLGIPTPPWVWCNTAWLGFCQDKEVIRKPVDGGGKNGIEMVAFAEADGMYLFEEYIFGCLEISVYILGTRSTIILPPLARYRSQDHVGILSEWGGGEPSSQVLRNCVDAACKVHRALQCRGITKTDFVIGPDGHFFAIETDSHPALGRTRGAATQAARYGMSYGEMIGVLLHG